MTIAASQVGTTTGWVRCVGITGYERILFISKEETFLQETIVIKMEWTKFAELQIGAMNKAIV